MILVEGRVKITTAATNGRERILNILEPGETFGEIALLDGAPRCADAEAMEPTSAIVVGRESFEELPACDPMVARRGIADLCTRVRKTTAVVEDTLFLSPATRQARRLRALVQQGGGVANGHNGWTLEGLSLQELADAVGLTRESVNRQLRPSSSASQPATGTSTERTQPPAQRGSGNPPTFARNCVQRLFCSVQPGIRTPCFSMRWMMRRKITQKRSPAQTW